MKPRPDPDQLQQWVIRDGVPPSQVGTRLGLSRATGYEWLRRYAIRAGGPAVSQDQLRDGWHATPSPEQLAAGTGLPPEAVTERLITAGVMASARPYVMVGATEDPLPEPQLRQWHVDEGRTAAQIAAMTGTTVRQVRYRLSQHNLTRRRPEPAPKPAPPSGHPLLSRLAATRRTNQAASAATADNLTTLIETIKRLKATTLEARRAVQQSAARRSGTPDADADQRPHG